MHFIAILSFLTLAMLGSIALASLGNGSAPISGDDREFLDRIIQKSGG
jgi:hypothetical protein